MRVSCTLRAIIRSHEDAITDVKKVYAAMSRYGMANQERQPRDANPFSISSTQGPMYLHKLSNELNIQPNCSRPLIDRPENFFQKMLNTVVDPKWVMHRSAYLGARESFASREAIVLGSREALTRILEAIKKKDLSSLSPLLHDDRILPGIAEKSNLSSLTDRQLKCLDVSEEDFVGIDGIVDRWKRVDLAEDDPSGLLSSIRVGMSDKHDKAILSYSVDIMAVLRKNILVSKLGSLQSSPAPKGAERRFMPAPKAYGLPYIRFLYATVEFAHMGTSIGKFSEEPFLLNFHVHSF